jgi:NADH:ubiquinone oxidoreductase subunit 2 (subunit N)
MDLKNRPPSPIMRAGAIVLVSLSLGIFFDYFFYEKAPGISVLLYVALIVAGIFSIARAYQRPIKKEVFWILLPLFFFGVMVFVRSNALLVFLNISASVLLLLVIAKVSFGDELKKFLLGDYIKIIFLPFHFVE